MWRRWNLHYRNHLHFFIKKIFKNGKYSWNADVLTRFEPPSSCTHAQAFVMTPPLRTYFMDMPHIGISPCTKFRLKQLTLNFRTKFAQKEYFGSKTKEVNITIEFFVFELVIVPNFSWNRQYWLFGPNLPTKNVSGQKWKKWTSSPLNSAYWN